MKPKRRYTNVEQIEAEIESAKQRAHDLLRSADSLDTIAKENFKMAELKPWYREQGVEEKQKAEKARITATTLLERKVKYLTEKMAEIQTLPIPGILEDTSVEA